MSHFFNDFVDYLWLILEKSSLNNCDESTVWWGFYVEQLDTFYHKGTEYLAIFGKYCEEICSSEAFVSIATAGRHGGLSNIYIKHDLFHQSKLRSDVELQNTLNVLFKSPRDVMQVSTLKAKLALGSEQLIGNETKRLYPTVFCWLTYRHEQTIHYSIVQTPDPFPKTFVSRTN